MTIFAKIIAKEIPAKIVYEDDLCIAIDNIAPQAEIHTLVIPKKPIPALHKADDADAALLGHLLVVVNKVADVKGIRQFGYRVMLNAGEGGEQEIMHLHLHVMSNPHSRAKLPGF